MAKSADSEIKRVGRFGIVGVVNSLIDFGFYNLFAVVGLALPVAKILSAAIAVAASFFANRRFVFRVNGQGDRWQGLRFILVSVVSAFGLGPLTVYFLTKVWLGPVQLGQIIAGRFLSHDLIVRLVSFGGAVAVSLVWNYILYKKVVFKT